MIKDNVFIFTVCNPLGKSGKIKNTLTLPGIQYQLSVSIIIIKKMMQQTFFHYYAYSFSSTFEAKFEERMPHSNTIWRCVYT